MKSLPYGISLIAAVAVFACGDDDTKTSSPPAADGGTSSSSSSSGATSSSGGTSSSSSSSSSSGASGTTDQEKIYCDAVASRTSGCGKSEGICTDAGKCIYARLMKPEATAAYAKCFGAPSCKTDDRCVSDAGLEVGGTAASDYTDQCLKKREECGTAFTADFCGTGAFAYPGVGEAAAACLPKACGDIKACFVAAYSSIQACK